MIGSINTRSRLQDRRARRNMAEHAASLSPGHRNLQDGRVNVARQVHACLCVLTTH